MNQDGWEKIVDKIDQQFGIDQKYTADLEGEAGGSKEVVEFSGPQGDMKLEFATKPRFLGETTLYSNRIGGDVTVEKQYDDNDMVNYFSVFKKTPGGDWEEISANMFSE